ncbi:MAG: hypothetical protein MR051_08605 [Lentisphaeria bacterium]|nr:hypothetical protein [Lentisphaeria bacterium]
MKRYRHNFTLVELLAAMAVFCVLLLVSMRLFSGSQRLWVRAEQKTNTFADARTAMEFIATRLQTLVYFEDMPFGMSGDEIWFLSNYPDGERNSAGKTVQDFWYFTKFERNPYTGCLTMKTFNNEAFAGKKNFQRLLPPYLSANAAKTAWNNVLAKWRTPQSSGSPANHEDIIENVTSFKIFGFFAKRDGNEWKAVPGNSSLTDAAYCRSSVSTYDFPAENATLGTGASADDENTSASKKFFTTPPYLVEVEISLLDSKERYDEWKAADAEGKKDLESEYGYTFRRAILLGQRSVDE